ncbi:YbaK/EbsC family protein [Cupriavidus sp. 2SB]|uniref:YbaK/EbsC family protein n=1 Tax=Cupriavidus sp. 2SB TaxID=2502199 RepID=UPI001484DEB0|nr:YbaK/EbsC family protein [Cupriavidus sp. 2SB]
MAGLGLSDDGSHGPPALTDPSATLGNASIDGNHLTCSSHSTALHVRAVTTMAAWRTFFKKATLASAEEAQRETGCVIGAIPPFTFSSRIDLIVDPQLTDSVSEIAFNAGRLDVDRVELRGLHSPSCNRFALRTGLRCPVRPGRHAAPF